MNKLDLVAHEKPPASRYQFPAAVLNVDGSICMLIPPGSYSMLKDLVKFCSLPDEPSSFSVVVAALVEAGHTLVTPSAPVLPAVKKPRSKKKVALIVSDLACSSGGGSL